jgi:alanyl-tRNA synthetase
MITTRLYFHDSYLAEFSAHVIGRSEDGLRICLDRTAFYPDSGGQPHDLGHIAGVRVLDVIDENERIAHLTAEPVEGTTVECRVDWDRRFDHMQQHTGQHLLSAVLLDLYGFDTVGFHLGAEASTIDISATGLDPEQVAAVEKSVNQRVFENRPVVITLEAEEEAQGLRRRPSDRHGVLRIVSIEGLDRSPCGGTHVRSTSEIGPVAIRKLDKIRGNVRIEFLCGHRAVRRARADFAGMARIARVYSAPLDECPALVEAQRDALLSAQKSYRRAATELARYRGQDLYRTTAPGPDGVRRSLRRQPAGVLDDELRALAQGFTAQSKAVFLAAIDSPPAALLAVSEDAGLHAGNLLKAAVAKYEGRGGGNALLGQGSVGSLDLLERLLAELAGC